MILETVSSPQFLICDFRKLFVYYQNAVQRLLLTFIVTFIVSLWPYLLSILAAYTLVAICQLEFYTNIWIWIWMELRIVGDRVVSCSVDCGGSKWQRPAMNGRHSRVVDLATTCYRARWMHGPMRGRDRDNSTAFGSVADRSKYVTQQPSTQTHPPSHLLLIFVIKIQRLAVDVAAAESRLSSCQA